MSTTAAPRTTPSEKSVRGGHLIALLAALAAMYGTGIGFLLVQESGDYGVWAPLSDAASALFALAVLTLALRVGRDFERAGQSASRPWAVVGVIGAGLTALASLALVLSDTGVLELPGAPLGAQFVGFAIVGVWLAAVGAMTLRSGRWSRVAGWAALIGGVGQAAGMVFTALGMYTSPLFGVAFLATVAGMVTWAVSLLRASE